MTRYRKALPQLDGSLFLADAGIETDLIFNHGIEIREFAAHTLLPEPAGRAAVARYFEGFLALAREMDAGFVLDTVTWKAHRHGPTRSAPLRPSWRPPTRTRCGSPPNCASGRAIPGRWCSTR